MEQVAAWLAANLPESPPATIVHGDYRLGQHDVRRPGSGAAGGDPRLGDGDDRRSAGRHRLPDDPLGARPPTRRTQFTLHSVTTRPGFPSRAELVSRYERAARAGRCVQLDWYVTLALWKAVVFMEGNYKRAVSGATDDPYLKSFGEGVVELAAARARCHPPRLLVPTAAHDR